MMTQDYSFYRTILSNQKWNPDFNTKTIPQKKLSWLMCEGSLTKELQKICHTFEVLLLNQGWRSEINKNSKIWLREVLLQGDNIPWIFAQTVVPEITVNNVAQEILTLGEKPLGLWLFPQEPIRITLEWYQDPISGLLARRSILKVKNYPIEIKELFLKSFSFQ